MDKILTIVIPTYNMQDYLRCCLDSLIVSEEQMAQLEVLVINDGSKDNSSAIAHEYQDKYPDTFRVIDKENGNYGSCVNRGLKEATAKYVKVLDADDSFDNVNFKEYIDFLCHSDADLIVNDFSQVNEVGNITKTTVYDLPVQSFVFDENTRNIFNKKNFQMHAAAYKLENVQRLGYKQTEGISYTDQEWIYTPLLGVQTVAYFNKVLYLYLVGRVGQTMSPDILKKNISQNQKCILRILNDFSNISSFSNQSLYDYLKDQAFVSMRYIYFSYLVRYRDLDLEGLIDFDSSLNATDQKLLNWSDTITLPNTSCHYVKFWHQNHKRPTSLLFYMNLFISKIARRLKN